MRRLKSGSCDFPFETRNSKLEIGFPGPPQDGCPKTRNRFAERGRSKFELPNSKKPCAFVIGISNLEFVSSFEFRVSDLSRRFRIRIVTVADHNQEIGRAHV